MGSASIKEIKNRIHSIENTRQITSAMQLVAAGKLRKAQARIEASRPYFRIIYSMLQDIIAKTGDMSLPYLEAKNPGAGVLYVVIAGDRGLAGGYNSAILKATYAHMQGRQVSVLPIGKRARDFFTARGVPLVDESFIIAENVSIADCFTMAKNICREFENGAYSEVRLAYTEFVSVLTQQSAAIKLLPLAKEEAAKPAVALDICYEPDSETAFKAMIPEYIGGVIYGALCESRASEQAARRSAMDTATQNADEMIDTLSLKYNQARQAAITQEITEIVAGS
ncbi:MAG: ATP synthase F1 subunit gamma [Clostridia bacterium]|nr:ATP synthase F1 subunit gamma [Clostridia bacterium]